jgi:predicted DNA-binding protein (UPF0251 family)
MLENHEHQLAITSKDLFQMAFLVGSYTMQDDHIIGSFGENRCLRLQDYLNMVQIDAAASTELLSYMV